MKKAFIGFFALVGICTSLIYFYEAVFLRYTRLFKTCPYFSKKISFHNVYDFNSEVHFENINNSFLKSNKLLIKDQKTNKCLPLINFLKDNHIPTDLFLRIKNIPNLQKILETQNLIIEVKYNDLNSYKKVSCPKNSFVIAFFGQSNTTNQISQKFDLKIPNNLYQYNWRDKNCYLFKEPLLGNTGLGGNAITPFAATIAKETQQNIVLVTFGQGGSVIESWSQGGFSPILRDVLQGLKGSGLSPDIFLWHQGESNAINAQRVPNTIKEDSFLVRPLLINSSIFDSNSHEDKLTCSTIS